MVRSIVGIVCGVLVIALLGAMARALLFHGAVNGSMPPLLESMSLLMHGLAAIVGGYLGAAIARRRPAAHGLAVGVLSLVVAQYAPTWPVRLPAAMIVHPLWLTGLGMVAGLAGAVLGGLARGQTGATATGKYDAP